MSNLLHHPLYIRRLQDYGSTHRVLHGLHLRVERGHGQSPLPHPSGHDLGHLGRAEPPGRVLPAARPVRATAALLPQPRIKAPAPAQDQRRPPGQTHDSGGCVGQGSGAVVGGSGSFFYEGGVMRSVRAPNAAAPSPKDRRL